MTTPPRPWYTILYVQVLLAIAVGILIGHFFPEIGVAFKPLGDGFISLIKMMIAPVIFCTVVHGIGSMRDLKKVGRVGVKTLFYFEAVSTLALVIGLVRDGAAAHDPEDGTSRRLEVGRRFGDPHRLQLQSRRHQHLYDVVDTVPGASHRHAAHDHPGARHPRHRHDHVEGRLGRDRGGLRDAGGDARDRARHPDPIPCHSARDRQVHERMPLTNLVGNGVATVVISRWESELDVERLNKVMANPVALGEAFEEQPG